jgi:hypothetical protein
MEDDISLLARSTVPVVILEIITNATPVPFLETLYKHVPHLVYLQVMSIKDIFIPPTVVSYHGFSLVALRNIDFCDTGIL